MFSRSCLRDGSFAPYATESEKGPRMVFPRYAPIISKRNRSGTPRTLDAMNTHPKVPGTRDQNEILKKDMHRLVPRKSWSISAGISKGARKGRQKP